MNDAQTWTLIAGFFALMATMIGMTLRGEGEMLSWVGASTRWMAVRRAGARLDHLDRDVQMIVNRLMEG